MEVGNVVQRLLGVGQQEGGQELKRGEGLSQSALEDQVTESPLRMDTLAVLRENIQAAATRVEDAEEAGKVMARIQDLIASEGGNALMAHSRVASANVLDLVGV
ncbi:MAG: hypothetical protein AB1797_04810 [bacterium]